MKCTNCGKNNAMYHYHFEMNGETHQAHLCEECARKLEPEKEFAAKAHEMFGDMFDRDFFGGSLFDGRPMRGLLDGFFDRDPFEGFFGRGFSPFAMLGMPRIEISFPDAGKQSAEEKTAKKADLDPELAKKREMNALREQMRAAAESEDYEKAAELRDKLRAMENSADKKE